MHALGGPPGRCCLHHVLLGLAQLSHRDGQPGQVGQQGPGQHRAVTAKVARQREEPSHGTQAITVCRAARYPPVGQTGRAVIGIRCHPQHLVVQRVRCDIEGGGRRPGRIGGRGRVAHGAAADPLRCDSGLSSRVPVQQLALRGREPERPGASSRPVLMVPAVA